MPLSHLDWELPVDTEPETEHGPNESHFLYL